MKAGSNFHTQEENCNSLMPSKYFTAVTVDPDSTIISYVKRYIFKHWHELH